MRRSLAALCLGLAFGCSEDDPPSFEVAQVDVSLVGSGRVISAPAGIDCGGACSRTFPAGARVELTASAPDDGTFLGWSGACAGETCRFDVARDVQITATFAEAIAPLEVRVEGPGVVESDPSGISCRDRCTYDYRRGDQVVLTATPDPNVRFVGWSGACDDESCELDMAGRTSVVAVFAADPSRTAEVRIQVLGPGMIATDLVDCRGVCELDVPVGTALDFIATPGDSARFTGWGDACAGRTQNLCQLEVGSDLLVTGSFESIEGYDLTVLKDGNGSGLVTSEDGLIDCGPICTATYDGPAMVQLIASPEGSSQFEGWTGCASTADERCTVDPTQVSVVVARFGAQEPTLDVSVLGAGQIVSLPSGIDCPTGACTAGFPFGIDVSLIPVAGARTNFWRWEGDCTGSDPASCLPSMTTARSVTGVFGSACNEWSVNLSEGGSIEAQSDPRMNTGTALTIETWFLSIAGISGEIAARRDEGAQECAFALETTPGQIAWCVYSGCGNNGDDRLCVAAQSADVIPRWRHVAAVFEAPAALRLYVDGLLVNDAPIESGSFAGSLPQIAQPFRSSFQTYLASMRMSSAALYASNFMPQDAPPPLDTDVFDWLMEEAAGDTVFDASQSGINGQINNAAWVGNGPVCP